MKIEKTASDDVTPKTITKEIENPDIKESPSPSKDLNVERTLGIETDLLDKNELLKKVVDTHPSSPAK